MNSFLFFYIYLIGDTMINFKLILKGMIIGLAKIIPGVSGSLLAVSLGIYSIAIEAISYPFRNIKENILFLGNVGIGILISIVLCSNIVSFFISHYFFVTVLLFVGFILGTFPELINETRIETKKDYIVIGLIALLIFLLSNFRGSSNFIYENTFGNNLYVFFLGFIDAATMVIPGISGTAIFLLLGSYSFILDLFGSLSNVSTFFYYLVPLFFFAFGLFVGVILISKLMNYALQYKKKETYLCIFGFALSSIFLLCMDLFLVSTSIFEVILGIFLFIVGYKISIRLNI